MTSPTSTIIRPTYGQARAALAKTRLQQTLQGLAFFAAAILGTAAIEGIF